MTNVSAEVGNDLGRALPYGEVGGRHIPQRRDIIGGKIFERIAQQRGIRIQTARLDEQRDLIPLRVGQNGLDQVLRILDRLFHILVRLRTQADIRDTQIGGDPDTALDLSDRGIELLFIRDIVDYIDTRQTQITVIEHAQCRRGGIILEYAALLGERGVIDIMGLDALEFEILGGCAKFFKRNIMPALGGKGKFHRFSHTFRYI